MAPDAAFAILLPSPRRPRSARGGRTRSTRGTANSINARQRQPRLEAIADTVGRVPRGHRVHERRCHRGLTEPHAFSALPSARSPPPWYRRLRQQLRGSWFGPHASTLVETLRRFWELSIHAPFSAAAGAATGRRFEDVGRPRREPRLVPSSDRSAPPPARWPNPGRLDTTADLRNGDRFVAELQAATRRPVPGRRAATLMLAYISARRSARVTARRIPRRARGRPRARARPSNERAERASAARRSQRHARAARGGWLEVRWRSHLLAAARACTISRGPWNAASACSRPNASPRDSANEATASARSRRRGARR